MKDKYLQQIKTLLEDYEIDRSELNDILSDYSNMYEDGIARGLSDKEVVEYLGSPEKVVRELGENYKKLEHKNKKYYKFLALMPFLCTIVYFILGRMGYWHPGWMVFLLIPITAIATTMFGTKNPHALTALSPFGATIIYMLVGFYAHIWHPTWLIFLIVPILGILNSSKTRSPLQTVTALSPFLAVIAFFLLGLGNYWNPGWLVFLMVPMIGILNMKNREKAFLFELCFVAAIVFYLFMGYVYQRWDFGALAFFLPVAYGIIIADIRVESSKKGLATKIAIVATAVIYFICGVFFNSWGYLWLIFLLVPVVSILVYSQKKDKFLALTPFISIVIFFLLGYFFDLWSYAWIAFMLIPIVGILKK